MTPFQAAVLATALLCSLVAGFLFAFAAVVMPGIRRLDDGGFLRAFQAVDRVIQDSQPLFVVVWVGSVLATTGTAVWGLWALGGSDRLLLVVAALLYLLGVQLPTIAVNVPLNNRLQRLDVASMTEAMRARAREGFEPRWNRWNVIRAWCAGLVSVLLLRLLLRV